MQYDWLYTKVNSPHLKNTRVNCGIENINYTAKEILTMKLTENKTDFCNISEWGETAIGRYYNIGMWGERRREYLKNHRPALYNHYQMNMTLLQHLEDTQLQAQHLYETLIKQLAEKENVTEQLKAENQMEWVRQMNNIRQRATEIVNREIIYR